MGDTFYMPMRGQCGGIRYMYLWFYTELDDTWDTLIPHFLTHNFSRKSNDAATYRSASSHFASLSLWSRRIDKC